MGGGLLLCFHSTKRGEGFNQSFFFQGRGWVIVEGCFGGCAKECAYSNKIVEIKGHNPDWVVGWSGYFFLGKPSPMLRYTIYDSVLTVCVFECV